MSWIEILFKKYDVKAFKHSVRASNFDIFGVLQNAARIEAGIGTINCNIIALIAPMSSNVCYIPLSRANHPAPFLNGTA